MLLEEQLSKDGSDTKKVDIKKSSDRALRYMRKQSKNWQWGQNQRIGGSYWFDIPWTIRIQRKSISNRFLLKW